MKLEKKHWIIIGVVVAIILVWYFFLRKKKTESSYRMMKVSRKGNCPPGWKLSADGTKCVPDDMIAGKSIFCQPPSVMIGGRCVTPTVPVGTGGLGSAMMASTGSTISSPTSGGTAAKTYVYECRKKNADGTWTVTSGYSSSPSGNCAVGFTEKILKTME